MGWEQEMQYRHQYSSDGQGEMVWQPTLVYRQDAPKAYTTPASTSTGEATDALFMFIALAVTAAVYHLASHIHFVEHLSNLSRRILLGSTIVFSFLASAALLATKIVQTLIKVAIFALCAGILFRIYH